MYSFCYLYSLKSPNLKTKFHQIGRLKLRDQFHENFQRRIEEGKCLCETQRFKLYKLFYNFLDVAVNMPSHESPKRSPSRPLITRYGPNSQSTVSFAQEERFAWQKPKFQSDVVYDVKPEYTGRTVLFPGSVRVPLDENPDAKKRSTGPGSYDVGAAADHLSDYIKKGGQRFSSATRESMVMKTPSPGPVYTFEKVYYRGPEKSQPISFNCDSRKSLAPSTNTDADMLWPALPKGPSITIAKKLPRKEKGSDTPGAHYKIKQNFQTGPSFSFGKGRGDRFTTISILRGLES